ncbi:MAG: class I SAM-dependent methyltransferase [Comamonadaceae bacterium]|nr:class I SAM-dependent methyltransferase [Comamonadaceae bacterium]
MKQYAPSFEGNKDYILPVLREALPSRGLVLEVGSGAGQARGVLRRALSAARLAADRSRRQSAEYRGVARGGGAAQSARAARGSTCSASAGRQARRRPWCASTPCTSSPGRGWKTCSPAPGQVLAPGGVMYVYGAYRYATRPLEPSNEKFDQWLKDRDPVSGVRDFEAVNALAERHGLRLRKDRAMHGNNRSIWWVKG